MILRRFNHHLIHGLKNGDRMTLAKVITLAESTRQDHRFQFEDILNSIASDNKSKQEKFSSFRIGITGPPGAGSLYC